jgi:sec-independent protein translocase protein TatC
VGIIITTPFILYQLWKFIEPGLYEKERRWAKSITFFTTVCFFAGISFAYFVMIPSMLKFSASFGSQNIKNFIDVDELLSFMTTTLLAAGLIFELPMITFVLTKVGIVTPTMMRKYRRHSIVGILIIAAVMTPSPDPFNQMIFAIPLYILFELSIWVSSLATNQRAKESKEQ